MSHRCGHSVVSSPIEASGDGFALGLLQQKFPQEGVEMTPEGILEEGWKEIEEEGDELVPAGEEEELGVCVVSPAAFVGEVAMEVAVFVSPLPFSPPPHHLGLK